MTCHPAKAGGIEGSAATDPNPNPKDNKVGDSDNTQHPAKAGSIEGNAGAATHQTTSPQQGDVSGSARAHHRTDMMEQEDGANGAAGQHPNSIIKASMAERDGQNGSNDGAVKDTQQRRDGVRGSSAVTEEIRALRAFDCSQSGDRTEQEILDDAEIAHITAYLDQAQTLDGVRNRGRAEAIPGWCPEPEQELGHALHRSLDASTTTPLYPGAARLSSDLAQPYSMSTSLTPHSGDSTAVQGCDGVVTQRWHRMVTRWHYRQTGVASWWSAVSRATQLRNQRKNVERRKEIGARVQAQREAAKELAADRQHKARAAAAKRKGVMVNKWRQIQERLQEGDESMGKVQGEVYHLAETTARVMGTSMQGVVSEALRGKPVPNWQEGKRLIKLDAELQGAEVPAQQKRQVLTAQVQQLVTLIQGSELDTVPGGIEEVEMEARKALGRVLYTTAAGTRRALPAQPEIWDEHRFHAVRIKIHFTNGTRDVEAIGDTGAGPSLVPEANLSVEVLNGIKPGRARMMSSATAHAIKAKGGASVSFRLGDDPHEFRHEWQVVEGDTTPIILGNDFMAKYKAVFDFGRRIIVLTVNGREVWVPFEVGDEKAKEEEAAVYSLEDRLVPHVDAIDRQHCRA